MANLLTPEEIDALDISGAAPAQTSSNQRGLVNSLLLSPEEIDKIPTESPAAPVTTSGVVGERPGPLLPTGERSTTYGGSRKASFQEGAPSPLEEDIGPVSNAIVQAGRAVGRAVGRGGKLTEAAAADVAAIPAVLAGYQKPLENIKAFARQPWEDVNVNLEPGHVDESAQPLPIEKSAEQMKGVPRFVTKAALAPFRMFPQLAISFGLGAAGVPSGLASAIPMIVTEKGEYDPIGAAIAAGIPGASRIGEKVVASALEKIPIAQVVVRIIGEDPLKLKGKVVQQIGGIEFSNDVYRKFLEQGGGFVAANAYLLAAHSPAIMNLPPEQRKEAIFDMVAQNLAPSLLSFIRPGMSESLTQMGRKIAPQMQEAFDLARGAQAGTARPPAPPEDMIAPPEPGQPITPAPPSAPLTPGEIDAITPEQQQGGVPAERPGVVPQQPEQVPGQAPVAGADIGNRVPDTTGKPATPLSPEQIDQIPAAPAPAQPPVTGNLTPKEVSELNDLRILRKGGAKLNKDNQEILKRLEEKEGKVPSAPLPPSPQGGAMGTTLPPVPERPQTIAFQMEMLQDGRRNAVLISPGEPLPPRPSGGKPFGIADTPLGTFIYDPTKLTLQQVQAAVANNTVGDILGYGIPAKPQPADEIGVVVLRSADGMEKQAVVTDQKSLQSVMDAAKRIAAPGDTVKLESQDQLVASRKQIPMIGKRARTVLPATMETARSVIKMTPAEFSEKLVGFNDINIGIGQKATPAEYEELKTFLALAEKRSRDALELLKRTIGELKSAIAEKKSSAVIEKLKAQKEQQLKESGDLNAMPQFFREAIGAYEQVHGVPPSSPPVPVEKEATPSTVSKWKPIGINAEGNPIFEDENGVRSYVSGNIRVTQPVYIIPGDGIRLREPGPDFTPVSGSATPVTSAERPAKGRSGSIRPRGGQPATAGATPPTVETPAVSPGTSPEVQPGIRPPDEGQGPQPGGGSSGVTPPVTGGVPAEPKPEAPNEPPIPATPESAPTVADQSGNPPEPIPAGEQDPQRPKNLILKENPAPTGIVSRVNANIAAIELLKRLELANRFPTDEERMILAAWSGWGSFKEVFNEGKATKRDFDPGWVKRYGKAFDKLKALLTQEEFDAAADSSVNAHYTSIDAVHAMWDLARRLGYTGGRVLEGSAGSGVMIGYMPEDLAKQSKWVAVEMEPITGKILSLLYPEADVRIQPFERTKLRNGGFDLAITNVPFFDVGPGGTEYDLDLNLHNYCIARNLDKLRAGGIAILISSHNTMDARPQQRAFLATKADLVGAIRLPSNAFKESAGTEVVTDILVFRKPDGRPFQAERWANSVQITTPEGTTDINEYFAEHPEMVLGENRLTGTMYRKDSYTVEATPGDIIEKLAAAIAKFPDNLMQARLMPDEPVVETQLEDGFLVIGENGKVLEAKGMVLGKPDWDNTNRTLADRARDYIGLRDALRNQYNLERNPESTDQQIEANRAALKKLYEFWRRKHGALNLNERRINYLVSDPEYFTVLGLELVSQKSDPSDPTKTTTIATPADVLTERVIRPDLPPSKVTSGIDALGISLAYKGTLDMDYMIQISGLDSEQIESELIGSGLSYRDPIAGKLVTNAEYLTGDVREKLARAVFAAKEDPDYERNVAALKGVIPPDKPFAQISFEISARWLPTTVLNAFGQQVIGLPQNAIQFVPGIEEFAIKQSAGRGLSELARTVWSTKDMNAIALMQHALNFQRARITRIEHDGDKERIVVDVEASALANQLIDKIKEEFIRWAKSTEGTVPYRYFDADKGDYVEEDLPIWKVMQAEFNKKFSSFIVPESDGSKLVLPGLSSLVRRTPHLMNGVMRAIVTGNAVYGHGVGSGKTFLQLIAAHEIKRIGKAKKIIHAVKKSTVGQFRTSIERAYPGSKCLIPSKKDFDPANRQKLFARIASGNFDFIILTHEQLKGVPVDPKAVEAFFNEQIDQLRNILKEMGEASAENARSTRGMDPAVRNIVKKIKGLKKRLENHMKAIEKFRQGSVTWEDMGIDGLFVDESHNFKKMPIATQMDVKGIPTDFSQRAVDLLIKVRDIQRKTDGRNIFFASGTPVSNTLAELWVMFHATNPKLLEDFHIKTFDSFASTFAEVVENFELTPLGKWKDVTRMAKFKNGSALTVLTRMGMDVKMGNKELGLDVPEMKDGKPTVHAIPPHPGFTPWIDFVLKIAAAWENLDPKGRWLNSWVPITTMQAGIAAAIDPRLVFPDAVDHPNSKCNTLVRDVFAKWQEGKELRTTMMIFSDKYKRMNTDKLMAFAGGQDVKVDIEEKPDLPEAEGDDTGDTGAEEEAAFAQGAQGAFNLYNDVRAKLVRMGVPEHEIGVITEHDTDTKREALFNKVRQGIVRILIGGTEKIGEGVDVPQRMAAQFHFDPPGHMTPAKMEQRIGRLIRQGNMFSPKNLNIPVEVNLYAQERSMDAAIYQIIMTKSKMVTQALMGQYLGDEFDDPAGELTLAMAEMMAAATGDTRGIEVAKLTKEVRELKLKEGAYYRRISELRSQVDQLTREAQDARDFAKRLVALSEVINAIIADKDNISVYHPHSGKVLANLKEFESWLAQTQNTFEAAIKKPRDSASASIIINKNLRVLLKGYGREGRDEKNEPIVKVEYDAVFYAGATSEPRYDDPRWNSQLSGLQRVPSALAGAPGFAEAKAARLVEGAAANESSARAFADQFKVTKFEEADELKEKTKKLERLQAELSAVEKKGGPEELGTIAAEAKGDAPMIIQLEQQIAQLTDALNTAMNEQTRIEGRAAIIQTIAENQKRPMTDDEQAERAQVLEELEPAKEVVQKIDENLVDVQRRHAELTKLRLQNAMAEIPLPFGVTQTGSGTRYNMDAPLLSTGEEAYVTGMTELKRLVEDPRAGLTPDARKVAMALLNEPVMLHLDWSKLRLELKNQVAGGVAGGTANTANWLIQLAKGSSPQTFPHEIFHFLFELLPPADRERLEELRQQAISNESRGVDMKDPFVADFLSRLTRGMNSQEFAALLAVAKQSRPLTIPWLLSAYPLINPREFLAGMAGKRFAKEKLDAKDEPGWWERFLAKLKQWIQGLLDSIKRAIGLRPDLQQIIRELLAGKHQTRVETGTAAEEGAQMSIDEASLTAAEREAVAREKAIEQGEREGWIETQVFGTKDFVRGREQITPDSTAEAIAHAKAIFDEAGLPVAQMANGWWKLVDDGTDRTLEGEKLIEILKREISTKNEPGKHGQLLANLLNSVMNNYKLGTMSIFGRPVREELYDVAQSDRSARGLALGALAGFREDLEFISQNVDVVLHRIYSDRFGGPAIGNVLQRVLEHFRSWFTDTEIRKALAEAPELDALVTRLIGLNRRDEGGRVYRKVQALLKPKAKKTLAKLEGDARVQEAVDFILQEAAKQGIEPKKSPNKAMTPLQRLLLMVTPETSEKIDSLVAQAVADAERNAGIKATLKQAITDQDREELTAMFAEGGAPTPEAVEDGLKMPEFSHWKLLRDELIGYSPTTLKLVQDLIRSGFKGTRFPTGEAKPPDTRINLDALAKQPEAEVSRVLDAYHQGLEANIDLTGASTGTAMRVRDMVEREVTSQLEQARQRFRDPMFKEPTAPGAKVTDEQRLGHLINAGLFRDPRLSIPDMVARVASKSRIQALTPKLSDLIKKAFETPFYRQGELKQRFAQELVERMGIAPDDAARAADVFAQAFEPRFAEARQKALAQAQKSLTPQQIKLFGQKRALWQRIERAVNAGLFDSGDVLRAIATEHGWSPPTDAQVAQMKDLAAQEQHLRELTPKEVAETGNNPQDLAHAQADKEASTLEKRVAIKKKIEAMWARMTRPISLRHPWETRRNIVAAINELTSANLLLRIGFVPRQVLSVLTQGAIHTPTRATAEAILRWQNDKRADRATHLFRDIAQALGDAYKIRFASIRAALLATRAAFVGRGEARNVDRLMSSIAAVERIALKGDEYAANGENAKAFIMRVFSLIRLGYRVAQALDNLHGVPAEYQDIQAKIVTALREQGRSPAEIAVSVESVFRDMKAEWASALDTARMYLEAGGETASEASIKESAWNVLKRRLYDRIKELHLPADDFEEQIRLMRNTIGWNERETTGLGGVVARTMAGLTNVAAGAGIPLPLARFGNAIGIMINRHLTFTPLFFLAEFGGTEKSPWRATETDRIQRRVETTVFSFLGSILFLLAAIGAIVVRNRPPRDKEERDLFDAEGHKAGTVEIVLPDGKFIPLSLTVGPLEPVAPYLAAGGAVRDLLTKRDKAQAKLNAEAEAKGLEPGKIRPLGTGDLVGVAGEAAWASITSGRTTAGLIGSLTDYGVPNANKFLSSQVSPLVPGLPALQEMGRMAGANLDTKIASFWDFMLPLPTSEAQRLNLLGDPVGNRDAVQRIIQILTGGTYGPVDAPARRQQDAYAALFSTGYRPPSIDPNKGYSIDGMLRPMTDTELGNYTALRGQYLKEELSNLGDSPDMRDMREAYQRANARALGEVGVDVSRAPAQATTTAPAAAVSGPGSRRMHIAGTTVATSIRGPSVRSAGLTRARSIRKPGIRVGRRGPSLRPSRGMRIRTGSVRGPKKPSATR